MRGFYERSWEADWEPFRAFQSWPNIDPADPNLKFIDLDGDGRADILITKDEAFTWYPSLAEEGFGAALRARQSSDEEKGPRLVFADSEQSIFLADLSGDGLTDLVRIRNQEVCYWPNLGYGRFGAKIAMDNAPRFDVPDEFDQKRIRLADIDGSGTTDIIYLHRDEVRIYFNESGNRCSDAGHYPISADRQRELDPGGGFARQRHCLFGLVVAARRSSEPSDALSRAHESEAAPAGKND